MKKINFLLAVVFLGFTQISYASDTWFVTSLNWQPYSGAEMINEGNSVQKLKSILRSRNIETLLEFYPWSRAQRQATQKGYLGYFPAWPEEVKEGFIASPPIDWSEVAVMSMQENKVEFADVAELFQKYSVGLVRTYVYPEEIANAAAKYADNVFYADNELLLAKKLHAGRHDTAITDPLVMTWVAERNLMDGIHTLKVLYKKPLVIAMTDSEENKPRIKLVMEIFKQD